MELLADPFLWGLILCLVACVFIQGGVILDNINWGLVGLAILAVVLVLVLTTTDWGA